MSEKHHIPVAKLGRGGKKKCSMQPHPEHHGCAARFLRFQMITLQKIKELSSRVCNFVTFKKLAEVIQSLVGLIYLLERLKNYFNFYQLPRLVVFI